MSSHRPVDEDGHAVADDLRVDEPQRLLVARLAEEALAASEHDGEDHQPELVDEVVLDQRLHEPGAAVDDDVAVLLLLQLRDFLHDVALQHRRVVPLGLIQGRGDDVLGHVVELVGELAVPRRPGLGKALVGHAPQQQGLGRERFVELELVALVAAADLEAPASVLEVLGCRPGPP